MAKLGKQRRIAHSALTPYFMLKERCNGDIMAAEIRLFPCLSDNFGYLIHDPATKATASIDAPEARPWFTSGCACTSPASR